MSDANENAAIDVPCVGTYGGDGSQPPTPNP
jgi:hypothetical protein